jgi:hypothetical protein
MSLFLSRMLFKNQITALPEDVFKDLASLEVL